MATLPSGRIILKVCFRGDKNYINILDMPGFEAYEQNNLEQLFVNCFNEQLQNFYNQRVFAWELVS